jgi:hypothetical protein
MQYRHYCPLCKSNNSIILPYQFKERIFYKCQDCSLISSHSKDLPDKAKEKSRYLQHVNSKENTGYIHFLEQILKPLEKYLPYEASGLDYGCGPTPILADILRNKGYHCDVYDPFFYPETPVNKYDFITATECFEHFHEPSNDLEKITALINPGGVLAVMTETWQAIDTFNKWSYIRDLTHVCFYHEFTMLWIAKRHGFKLLHNDGKRVFIFAKVAG